VAELVVVEILPEVAELVDLEQVVLYLLLLERNIQLL
jgi:hypothetical protein